MNTPLALTAALVASTSLLVGFIVGENLQIHKRHLEHIETICENVDSNHYLCKKEFRG